MHRAEKVFCPKSFLNESLGLDFKILSRFFICQGITFVIEQPNTQNQ